MGVLGEECNFLGGSLSEQKFTGIGVAVVEILKISINVIEDDID